MVMAETLADSAAERAVPVMGQWTDLSNSEQVLTTLENTRWTDVESHLIELI
jgi:hypothetical protein